MFETFPNAPIIEALIDIRTQLRQSVTLADLEALHDDIKSQYPEKQKRMLWQGLFQLEGEKQPSATTQSKVMGYLFKSADALQITQFRLDGFSFSRLRPYTEWEKVYAEARRLWKIYCARTKPARVTRLATRYINSIEISSKQFDYDDYLTAAPKVPPGIPQLVEHFFTRLVVPFRDHEATAIIMQTPSDKQDPIKTAIILDIDVFKDVSLAPDDPKIDEIFAILREIKNKAFFSSITERTMELFR